MTKQAGMAIERCLNLPVGTTASDWDEARAELQRFRHREKLCDELLEACRGQLLFHPEHTSALLEHSVQQLLGEDADAK